jgi:deoxyxylulose-5-phosphate synthase
MGDTPAAGTPLLDALISPADLRKLGPADLTTLAGEIRNLIKEVVSRPMAVISPRTSAPSN